MAGLDRDFLGFMNFIKYGATIEDVGDSKRKKYKH
jgi:hypothetical protein